MISRPSRSGARKPSRLGEKDLGKEPWDRRPSKSSTWPGLGNLQASRPCWGKKAFQAWGKRSSRPGKLAEPCMAPSLPPGQAWETCKLLGIAGARKPSRLGEKDLPGLGKEPWDRRPSKSSTSGQAWETCKLLGLEGSASSSSLAGLALF